MDVVGSITYVWSLVSLDRGLLGRRALAFIVPYSDSCPLLLRRLTPNAQSGCSQWNQNTSTSLGLYVIDFLCSSSLMPCQSLSLFLCSQCLIRSSELFDYLVMYLFYDSG